MSATMGYTSVAELAHEMESLLDRVRRGERSVSAEVSEALFKAADALEQSIEAAVAEREGSPDVAPLVARLRRLGEGGEANRRPRPAAAAAPAGWSAPDPGGE